MASWFEDNAQSTGHTPFTYLNHVADAPALVPGKIKERNPAFISKQPGERHLK